MSSLDLSRLPEPLRSSLQKQLEAMPAEYRQKLEGQLSRLPVDQLQRVLSKNSALVEKLGAAASKVSGKPPPRPPAHKPGYTVGTNAPVQRPFDPHDHYNATIGRGDMSTPPLLVMLVIFAGVLAVVWMFVG